MIRSPQTRRRAKASDLSPFAEVDLGHAGIDGSLRGQAVEDLLTMIEHDHAVDDAHQDAHDVLDPDNCNAHARADTFEKARGTFHFSRVETAETFIRKQHSR